MSPSFIFSQSLKNLRSFGIILTFWSISTDWHKCRFFSMLGLSQKKQFYTKFSLTFEFTVPSFSKLYLDQCHKFIVISIFSRQIDSADFRFLSNFCLLNSDIHHLQNTAFLFKKVVQSKDVLYFWQRLWSAVGKALISSNCFRFLVKVWKEFHIGSKPRSINHQPY